MNNSEKQADHDQLRQLTDMLINGTATDHDIQQLEAMLEKDADARRDYLQYALIHAQLPRTTQALRFDHRVALNNIAPLEIRQLLRDDRSSRRNTFGRIVSLAVSIAAVVLIGFTIWPPPAGDPVAIPDVGKEQIEPLSLHYDNRDLPIDTVAMLRMSTDRQQDIGSLRTRSISPTTLRVDGGEAEFASPGGANVRVEGPAMFGVSSQTGGMLYDGSVHARLDNPNATYSVLTSNLKFVDLGTEFRVTVVDDQCVKLHVLDGEVDVQSRVRLPLHYWNFDNALGTRNQRAAIGEAPVTLGATAIQIAGIVGDGAIQFDNTQASSVRVDGGMGQKVSSGSMACSGGITIEAMIVSKWTGKHGDYDEIFRKEDGIYRILLCFQNDDLDYDVPDVPPGPCLSFGLHLDQHGYSELDVPLDGHEGRPTFEELTDGKAHHVVATYDSFTGKKAIYIDGKLCLEHQFPIGALILSGGPEPAHIGNIANSDEPFNGVIDEVAFYDFTLTPEEITTHYQNALSGKNYFGTIAEQLQAVRWQSVTRVTEGQTRFFNQITGLPLDRN